MILNACIFFDCQETSEKIERELEKPQDRRLMVRDVLRTLEMAKGGGLKC
jgi:hypothetical protein